MKKECVSKMCIIYHSENQLGFQVTFIVTMRNRRNFYVVVFPAKESGTFFNSKRWLHVYISVSFKYLGAVGLNGVLFKENLWYPPPVKIFNSSEDFCLTKDNANVLSYNMKRATFLGN